MQKLGVDALIIEGSEAAGIVICDHPIEDCVPVYYEEDSDIPITQYSMKYIEKAGLVFA